MIGTQGRRYAVLGAKALVFSLSLSFLVDCLDFGECELNGKLETGRLRGGVTMMASTGARGGWSSLIEFDSQNIGGKKRADRVDGQDQSLE